MTAFGWYPHNPRDFLDGVQGLGPDTIGAYIVVLDLIYAKGGACPADYRFLGGLMGCSVRQAKTLVERLIAAGKLTLEGDQLTNERAKKEVETQAKLSRNRSEAGAKGGRNRAENDADARKINDVGQAKPQAKGQAKAKQGLSYIDRDNNNTPTNQPLGVARAREDAAAPLDAPAGPGLDGGDQEPDHRPAELLPRIADACGLALTPAKRKSALATLADWLAGWPDCDTEADLLGPIRSFLFTHDGPTHSLARFDAVILDRKARAAPKPKPVTHARPADEPADVVQLRDAIRDELGEATADAWINPARIEIGPASVSVICPGAFHAEHVANHLKPRIGAVTRRVCSRPVEVRAA